jgi:hypothetical protein
VIAKIVIDLNTPLYEEEDNDTFQSDSPQHVTNSDSYYNTIVKNSTEELRCSEVSDVEGRFLFGYYCTSLRNKL